MGKIPFDKIPLEEQQVINELVALWQTRQVPPDLLAHIDGLSGIWGSDPERIFIQRVYENLSTGNRNRYAISSAYEFRRFLEDEYHRQTNANAQAKAREDSERKAREDFDALSKEMTKATTRAERVELGRKRAALAPYTGVSYDYKTHCWNCHQHISSDVHAQCPDCRYYICGSCGQCFCRSLNY